jgi:hypothetical protein
VVSNLARRAVRGETNRRAREHRAARSEAAPGPDELLERLEEQQRLARHVASLSEPYREALLRHYWGGESCADMARATGLTEASVRSRLARGRALLRERLESETGRERARALLLVAAGLPEPAAPALSSAVPILVMSKTSPWIPTALALTLLGLGALTWISFERGDPAQPGGDPSTVALRPESDEPERANAEPPADVGDVRTAVEQAAAAQDPAEVAAGVAPAAGATVVFARAVDEQGRPLAGARLLATDAGGFPFEDALSPPAGADGRVDLELPRGAWYRYGGREDGNAQLGLVAPRHAMLHFVGAVTPHARRDQGVHVLASGGDVRGVVRTSAGALPAGVEVAASPALLDEVGDVRVGEGPPGSPPRPAARPDASGGFELIGVPAGATRLWARAPGHAWRRSDVVHVDPDAPVEGVELVLEPLGDAARIAGTVVDPAGAPVEGAILSWNDPLGNRHLETETDASGRFALDARDAVARSLVAHDPGRRFGPSLPLEASAGETSLRLVLTPRRALALRIVGDEDGAPNEGASLLAMLPDVHADYVGQTWSHSDGAGRATLLARAADFEVIVEAAGRRRVELGPYDPERLPGEELEVRLQRQRTLRGRVHFEGRGVAGARLVLARDMGDEQRELSYGFPARYAANWWDPATSDDEGRFELELEEHGAGGARILLVDADGFALAERPVSAPDDPSPTEELSIELERGGAIEGRVLVHPARSPEGVVIGLSRGDGRPHFTLTDAQGRFRQEHLAAGPWRVEWREQVSEGNSLAAALANDAPFDWNAHVRSGETAHVELDLRWHEDLHVEGALTLDGLPALGWSAALQSPPMADREFELAPGLLDAQGRFRVEARPGELRLVLRSPADAPPQRRITLPVRVEAELARVERAFDTGVVSGTGAAALARLRLVQLLPDRGLFEVEFEADGSGAFEVAGAPAGKVSLQTWRDAEFGPGWYPSAKLDVVAGETALVRLSP